MMNSVFAASIDSSAKIVLFAITYHANKDTHEAFPSWRTLMDETSPVASSPPDIPVPDRNTSVLPPFLRRLMSFRRLSSIEYIPANTMTRYFSASSGLRMKPSASHVSYGTPEDARSRSCSVNIICSSWL